MEICLLSTQPNPTQPITHTPHPPRSVGSYFLAKMSSNWAVEIAVPFIYGLLIWWLTGLRRGAGAFFVFQGTNILTGMCASSIGYCLAALTADEKIAFALIPPILFPSTIFSGACFVWLGDCARVDPSWLACFDDESSSLNRHGTHQNTTTTTTQARCTTLIRRAVSANSSRTSPSSATPSGA